MSILDYTSELTKKYAKSVEDTESSLTGKYAVPAKEDEYVGLPRQYPVEEAIGSRMDLINRGFENIKRTPELFLQNKPFQSIASSAIGASQIPLGIMQRAEAAIANPVLELQQMMGEPENIMAYRKGIDYLKEPVKSTGKAVSGERLGEFGDPYRKLIKNPVLSEAAGTLGGLFTLNALTANIAGKAGSKALQSTNKKLIDEIANKNTQKIASSLNSSIKTLKNRADQSIAPFNNMNTNVTYSDLIDMLPEVHADTLKKAVRRISNIKKQTKGMVLDSSGKPYRKPLTIKNLLDFSKDVQDYIDNLLLQAKSAGKPVPNVSDLIELKKYVKSNALSSVPEVAKDIVINAFDVYGKRVPMLRKVLYDIGWSNKTKKADSAKIGKLLKEPLNATFRSTIAELVAADHSATKALESLSKWQRRVSPAGRGISLPAVAAASAFGSALANKVVRKAVNKVVPDGEEEKYYYGG